MLLFLATAVVLPAGGIARAEGDVQLRAGVVQADLLNSDRSSALRPGKIVDGVGTGSGIEGRDGRIILELEKASVLEHVLTILRTGKTLDVVAVSTAEVERLGADVEDHVDIDRPLLRIDPNGVDLEVFAALARVRSVHIDEFVPIASVAIRDSAYWHVDRLDQRSLPLDGRYHASTRGDGVLVYVVDSGIYPLRGNAEFDLSRTEAWYDPRFYTAERTLQGLDCNGHGTHVAGTVAGIHAGVAPGVRLISVKANVGCEDGFWTFDLLSWFQWIVDNRADTSLAGRGSRVPAVVNLSLGAQSTSTLLDDGVARMIRSGITVVVAAGNDNRDACAYTPARVGSAVTVGASDQSDRRASFSNHGRCVNVQAPGVGVLAPTVDSSTCPGLFLFSAKDWDSGNCMAVGTAPASGTSMAAPVVAGLAARYLETNRSASPSAVKQAIERGAISVLSDLPVGTTGRLASSLFLEGADPSRPTAPAMGNLRLGAGLTRPFAVRGGRAPVRFEVVGGALPQGLAVDLTGAVTGRVEEFGNGAVTVRATDAVGRRIDLSALWLSIGTPSIEEVSVDVAPGDRTLAASWPVSGFDEIGVARGAEVSRVEVRATPVEGGRARSCLSSRRVGRGAALASGCSINGLVNDTTYRVDLRALNRGGWSAWTDVGGLSEEARTPVPVAPSAIRSLGVQTVSGSVIVSWVAPAADGGLPPSYDVQLRRTGEDWVGGDAPSAEQLACAGLSARQRTCQVTAANASIAWGQSHEVRVRAFNAKGASSWVSSQPVTPFAVPALSGVVVEVASLDGAMSVGWDRLEVDMAEVSRGRTITRIEVRAVPTGSGQTRDCVVARDSSGALGDRCDVVALDNGRFYVVQMRARNSAGWTAWALLDGAAVIRDSLSIDAAGRWTPTPVPPVTTVRARAPMVVSVEAGIAEIVVTWEPSPSDEGSVVSGYRVDVVRAGDPEQVVATCETSELICVFVGLDDEVTYRVEVAAENQFGYGDAAIDAAPVQTLIPIGLGRDLAVPGSALEVWAGGFRPGSRVVIDLEGSATSLSETAADVSGRIDVIVDLPSDLPSGDFSIRVTGESMRTEDREVRAPLRVDGAVPVVESLVLSVVELDVSDGPGEFLVSLVVGDDLSGVESVSVWVEDAVGVTMLGLSYLLEGDVLSGVWRATFTVPRYAAAGEWRVYRVAVRDRALNEVPLEGEALDLLGPLGVVVHN